MDVSQTLGGINDSVRALAAPIEKADTDESVVVNGPQAATATAKSSHRRRRRPERRPVTWNIAFGLPDPFYKVTATDWILHTCCAAVWKHLLYARGLTPVPTHQLVVERTPTSTSGSRHRLSSNERKMIQTTLALDRLSTNCWLVVQQLEVRYVVLTLGASWTRPKEVYLLDFTSLADVNDTADESEKENITDSRVLDHNRNKKEYTLSTRLIRQVVQAECDAESQVTGKELLATIQRAATDQLSVTLGVTVASFLRAHARELDVATHTGPFVLPEVLVRRDFSIAGKRGVQRTARIRVFRRDDDGSPPVGNEQKDSTDDITREEELSRVEDHGITWLSLHSKVKGFRIPSLSGG